MSKFLFPLLYLGPKNEKRPDLRREVVFRAGPEHDKPYALVSEEEAEALIRRSPGLYAFPEDLEERIAKLYAVEDDEKPRRGRPKKEVSDV